MELKETRFRQQPPPLSLPSSHCSLAMTVSPCFSPLLLPSLFVCASLYHTASLLFLTHAVFLCLSITGERRLLLQSQISVIHQSP